MPPSVRFLTSEFFHLLSFVKQIGKLISFVLFLNTLQQDKRNETKCIAARQPERGRKVKQLTEMVNRHKQGQTNGIYAVCSAHPLVLEGALRYARQRQTPLLIEATSNQVDQFGGYTGMTPADFRGFVCQLARSWISPHRRLFSAATTSAPTAGRASLPSRR